MSITATRMTSEGELATAFPLGRDEGAIPSSSGGYCPFENLLLPGATIEVLHAELAPDGH